MKCKCKGNCKYNLDIELDMEEKDNIKLTIWRRGIFRERGVIIISKKELNDALDMEDVA